MPKSSRPWLCALALLSIVPATASCSSGRHGFTASPLRPGADPVYARAATFSGPVTGGHVVEPESAAGSGLPPGYVEQEFFVSGTASSLRAPSQPVDGRWAVQPSTSAPYETRVLVRRPADTRRFNGTVVVEWLNVSAGESDPDWRYLNPALSRAGSAYVGVSAQSLGVQGGASLLGPGTSNGLIQTEPSRYGALHHPGDHYALDIFAQVGRALRDGGDAAVLGGLRPKHVVAVGESQSAFYLTTFADAVQPVTQAYDGLFVHSRGGAGAHLDGRPITAGGSAQGLRIRTDLSIPVFMFETETDLVVLGYASARQPDTDRIRTWEVAGTAHADAFVVGGFASQLGCPKAINDGPQHPVVQAAFSAFTEWVSRGTPPRSPAPLQLSGAGSVHLAVDANGNALGGVRTPAVDVPVSTLSGVPVPGAKSLCSLFGSTTPFSAARLVQLYRDKANYLSLFAKDLSRVVADGYVLEADRTGLLQQAGDVPAWASA